MEYSTLRLVSRLDGKNMKITVGIFVCSALLFCTNPLKNGNESSQEVIKEVSEIHPGAYSTLKLLDYLKDKSVAIVSNHTGMVGDSHLVDTLLSLGAKISVVFAPEHGFRGDRPDGEKVDDQIDGKTGIPIVSLYGKNKKPSREQMQEIEVVVFDIQDVGARFYTYLSTLHYVMQSCTEAKIPLIVCDRPNPNIHYVDGPVLDSEFSSFVGLHPVPVVYGMTIGEYALMINGERWHHQDSCSLSILPCENYDRSTRYNLPIKPSPNLPAMESIYLYPSLCFFEGTSVSIGRGTDFPFTVVGEPGNQSGDFSFIPEPKEGASMYPKHQGKTCVGYDISDYIEDPSAMNSIDLTWLIRMFKESPNSDDFFNANGYFDKLAGTDELRLAILNGKNEEEIRSSWLEDIEQFETIRSKYLIYK